MREQNHYTDNQDQVIIQVKPMQDSLHRPKPPLLRHRHGQTAGSPLLQQSQAELLKQAQGQYLSPNTNPYLQGLYNQMAGDVTAGVQSEFSKAGRYGSGANQAVLARELGNLANQVYAPQYAAERQNMQNVLFQAPQLAQADYQDIGMLQQVGQQREGLQQAAIADAMQQIPIPTTTAL